MVYIRTDANENIATGHLSRCRTVAKKLRLLGESVIFIFREDTSVELLESDEKYLMIQEGRGTEIQQMISILSTSKDASLLLDLYEFDAFYMEQLKPYAYIITFDDLFREKFPVNMIINYNFDCYEFDYKLRYSGTGTKLLLGPEYVPLRDEFYEKKSQVRKTVSTIMLVCGGGDNHHVLVNLLKLLCMQKMNDRYKIIVIAGFLNTDLEQLYLYAKKFKNIKIYENVKNMAEIMNEVDIVVSAAGTVLYECCSMQKTTIFFTVADNQIHGRNIFSKENMMIFAGDVRCDLIKILKEILVQIDALANNYDMRVCMSEKMERLIDGKGAMRIAECIVNR